MIPLSMSCVLAGGLLILLGFRAPVRGRGVRISGIHILESTALLLMCAVLGLLATGMPVVAMLAGIAGAAVPPIVRRQRLRRSLRLRRAQWPVLLDDLMSAVRAGMNLPEAMLRVASGCGAEWDVFATTYRRSGDFRLSLDALRRQLADPIFDQVAQALSITRDVGGTELTSVLRSLGTFIRSELHVIGELEARQSWTINAARMAVAAPWVVLVLLSSRPATITAYSQPQGVLLLVGVAVTSAIAYAVMLRIARLERA